MHSVNTEEVAETPRLLKVNLQLFAEGDPADPPAADPQPSDPAQPSEPANPTPAPKQDKETNAAFAALRRQNEELAAKMKAADVWAEENFGKTHNIHTWDEYQKAIMAEQTKQKYESAGIDPDVMNEFIENHPAVRTAKEIATKTQWKETLDTQDKELSSDPKNGEFYKQWRDEIVKAANEHGVDYNTAFTVLCREKIAEIAQKPDIEKIKQDAVKEYIDKLKGGRKPIEGGGSAPVIQTGGPPKTFEEARKGALSMLNQLKE